MTESGLPSLPAGWRSDAVAGGVNLRVVSSGRKYVVAGAGTLAALAASRAMVHWNSAALTPWLKLSVIFAAVALWCTVGDEAWHLERNRLVHWIGVNGWGYSRRIQDASLEIRRHLSTNWSVPSYRLYGVTDGKSFFL